jgi:hypothetical protein
VSLSLYSSPDGRRAKTGRIDADIQAGPQRGARNGQTGRIRDQRRQGLSNPSRSGRCCGVPTCPSHAVALLSSTRSRQCPKIRLQVFVALVIQKERRRVQILYFVKEIKENGTWGMVSQAGLKKLILFGGQRFANQSNSS